jgi:hypothetical protein
MRTSFFLFMVFGMSFFHSKANAQNDPVIFMREIGYVVTVGSSIGFNPIKGELLSPPDRPVRTYACEVKLEGFETSIKEKNEVLTFEAVSTNFHTANALALLDKQIREKSGLTGYVNKVYSGPSPATQSETFESMTLLEEEEEGARTALIVCKRRNGAGYRIFIVRK